MSFSRFSVLAVFLMMVMSAFVALPTYNVGADEHEGGDGGPYLNAFPTGSGGDPEDYEMSVHSGEGGANITVEATELTEGVSYRIEWDISHLGGGSIATGAWNFTPPPGHVQYFIGPDILNEEDFDPGCYVFTGWLFEHFQILIEMESWVFTLDYPIEACNPDDDCPFDPDVVGSPCEDVDTNPCWGEGNHDTEACHDYVVEYCATHNDPGCYRDGGGDEGDFGPSSAHIDVSMIELGYWEAHASAVFDDPIWANEMRMGIAGMCAEMMGTGMDEITEECFNHWNDMTQNDGPSEGDYDRGCPHDMDDETCDAFRSLCHSDDPSRLDCFRAILAYCDNHDDQMCHEGIASESDGGPIFRALFDYEDGIITSEEFMDFVVDDFYGGDGSSESALYDTSTFTVEEDGVYSLRPFFGRYWEGGHDFVCGNGDTVPFHFVNDGWGDCPDGADEQWYDNGTTDTSDDCQMWWNSSGCDGSPVNWFDCHDDSDIWVVDVNDGTWDCPHGEDENWGGDTSHWYGHTFLYAGGVTDIHDSANLVGAVSERCDYERPEYKAGLHCEPVWEGPLGQGDYTIVTAGSCYYDWTDEDGDGIYEESDTPNCYNHGYYTHFIDRQNSTGGWENELEFDGEVVDDDNYMEITQSHYNLMYTQDNTFSLYDAHEFTVDTGGFSGSIVSAHYQCEEDTSEDCWRGDMVLYLYEGSFDPESPDVNLMAMNDETDGYGLHCPAHDCGYSRLNVDLSAGEYVVVTAGYDTWSEGYYNNDMVRHDGEIDESWDGQLKGRYWYCCDDDGNDIVVDGDERTHMPEPWNSAEEDALINSIIENIELYRDGTREADEAASTMVSLMEEADEAGFFRDDEDDGYDGTGEDDCPFDSEDFCYEIGPSCDNDGPYYDPWHCGSESAHYCMEDGTDDEGCAEIAELVVDCDAGEVPQEICDAFNNFDHDAYHDEMDDAPVTLEGIEGVEDPDDWSDRMTISSENVIGNLADNEDLPMLMEQSFTITFDDVDESLDSHVLVIPSNSDDDGDDYDDDETWFWEITFTVADGYRIDSCDGCDAINDATFSDDGSTITFTMDSDATHDVAITFSTSTLCDHIIGIDSTGMAFDPNELTISVGDTVCWQWEDTADAHNVLEIAGEFDAAAELTDISTGFASGEPSKNVDFRHTFTENDKTHYYVCEPHASVGMVGKIIVGEGTPEDPVEQAVDDSGLPSVGFVVGALVLVGAAGLRRRIH
ncbi:MAG: plastocyanin/azurin family copper-binding protein [Candidatus Thermoplasmatota archaeon]|nr:plastocyanin/azurin family copper-binding protein [Candidatus Thermoplasmatota archaeon]